MTHTPQSPYKGLVPFEDSDLDALLFFGRERESEIIAANVLAARLTVLYGPSGVGKTSVLRAGVAHHLRGVARENMKKQGHPEFAVVVFDSWSDDPVAGLLAAVREELTKLFGSALLDQREGESLAETLGRWSNALACDLLLILDQAEEYFLYQAEEGGLADELPDLVTAPGLQVRVLLALRDDALSKLDRFKGRIPNLFGNYLRLDHLDRRSAGDAIVKPVERYNELTGESVEIEPALIEAVLDETAAGQVDLGETGRGLGVGGDRAGRIEAAYLQLVLERIWVVEREAGSTVLRAEALARLGGSEAIVRAHLRRAVEDLSPEEKDVAADIFRYLVTPSGAKIAHGAGDLAEYASIDERRLLPVLSTLGRERIVRTVDGAGTNGARYEIFHDVLGEAVLAWRREQELERERRVAAKRHRRLLFVAIALLIGLAAMAAVAVYALALRSDARASARSAQARELAALAQSELPIDPLRSIGLAFRGAKLEPTTEAENVLRNTLIESKVRKILDAGRGSVNVNSAAYSPNGTRVVTASDDGTARVFRVRDGALLATLRHRGPVTRAAFSADGRQLVTASRDGTARLWSASGRLLRTFHHDGAVLDLALTPDSKVLVTIAADGTVHEWSLADVFAQRVFREPRAPSRIAISGDGRRAVVVGGDTYARVYDLVAGTLLTAVPHDGEVVSAAFGPSAETLVTGSRDDQARTWNLRSFSLSHLLKGHQGDVVDVAVSRGGQYLATASLDGTADIWDLARNPRGHLVATLLGHTNFVTDVAFSPNGLYVITSSRDGTARVWDVHGSLQAVLAGHDGAVRAASFSPNGARVLTYGEDGTARIWDAGVAPELSVLGRHRGPVQTLDLTRKLAVTASGDGTARIWKLDGSGSTRLSHRGPVRDAAFSPNGQLVITASTDRTARIWSASGLLRQTLPHPAAVETAVFGPQARVVATAAADGRVRIWETESGRMIGNVPGLGPLSFSPDGKRLAAAESDGSVRLWGTRTGKPERTLSGHRKRIVALTFSPDGSLLLTGSKDRTARLWDLDSPRVRELRGHTNELTSARFSPDGRLVVTASKDNDVRLWDVQTGRVVKPVLSKHFAIVSDARFSDDGRWLVTAGPKTAGLWQVRSHKLISLLRGPLSPRLVAAAFVPGTHTIVTAGDDGTIRTYSCDVCAGVKGLEKLASTRLAEVGNRH